MREPWPYRPWPGQGPRGGLFARPPDYGPPPVYLKQHRTLFGLLRTRPPWVYEAGKRQRRARPGEVSWWLPL